MIAKWSAKLRPFRHLAVLVVGFVCSVLPPQFQGQLYPALHAYETCQFADGLQVVDVASLGPGVRSRPVETGRGTFPLPLLAGRRVMFAYPGTDFFANVKVEVLPAEHFKEEKKLVIENFDFILNGRGGNLRDEKTPPRLKGLETHGLNRPSIEGGVLGIYLLVDDVTHVLTTIYFLNQEPEHRKFSTMEQYISLRNGFLNTYSACIRSNEVTEAQ